MSKEDELFLGFTVQEIIRWSLVLLIVVAGFGSIIDGGALSGDYRQSDLMVYIPTLLFLYFAILALLLASGLEPNKFETVVIPLLIISMIVVALFYANLIPPVNNGSDGETETESETQTEDEISRTTIVPSDTNSSTGSLILGNGDDGNQGISLLWRNILTSLSIIALLMVLGGALYWLVSRKQFDPDIQIHKVNEYTKSAFESNNTIIEYYIDASRNVETLKGRAPHWYSPTNFSGHVIESPGPPLSSYFDNLTALYEAARFGKVEMSHESVEEAKDLHHQVINQVAMIREELRQKDREDTT